MSSENPFIKQSICTVPLPFILYQSNLKLSASKTYMQWVHTCSYDILYYCKWIWAGD